MLKGTVSILFLLLLIGPTNVIASEPAPTETTVIITMDEPRQTSSGPQLQPEARPQSDLGQILMQIAAAPVIVTEVGVRAATEACEKGLTFFEKDVLATRRFISRKYLDPSGFTFGFGATNIYQTNARGGLDTSGKKQRLSGS